jgi:hypothetical protein
MYFLRRTKTSGRSIVYDGSQAADVSRLSPYPGAADAPKTSQKLRFLVVREYNPLQNILRSRRKPEGT